MIRNQALPIRISFKVSWLGTGHGLDNVSPAFLLVPLKLGLCLIKKLHPDWLLFYGIFLFLPLVDVLGEFFECSVIAFFVWIVVVPFVVWFSSINLIIFSYFVRLAGVIDSEIISKSGWRMEVSFKWSRNLRLVNQFFIWIDFPKITFRVSLIWIVAE